MGRERWEERPGSLFSPHTHAPKGSPELSQAVPGLPQQGPGGLMACTPGLIQMRGISGRMASGGILWSRQEPWGHGGRVAAISPARQPPAQLGHSGQCFEMLLRM